jgi:hypothetical protein
MKTVPLLFLLPALLACGTACAVDDALVLRCRALPDGPGRYACYEALPVAQAAGSPTAETRFGLARVARKEDEEPGASRSTVRGRLDGWRNGTRIALANGQVWRVVDDTEAVLPDLVDPAVRIERGALGAYYLTLDANRSAARVVSARRDAIASATAVMARGSASDS